MTEMIEALNAGPEIQQAFWVPLAMLGGSIVSGLMGRSTHRRQTSSEELRHKQSLDARERESERQDKRWREWAEAYREAEAAHRARQTAAISSLLGAGNLAGIPAGFDAGGLVRTGGPPMPDMGGIAPPLPVTTAGAPAGGGGMSEIIALLPYLMGQSGGSKPGAGIFAPGTGYDLAIGR